MQNEAAISPLFEVLFVGEAGLVADWLAQVQIDQPKEQPTSLPHCVSIGHTLQNALVWSTQVAQRE